jgi:integrase
MRKGVLLAGVEAYLRHCGSQRFLARSTVKSYGYQLHTTFQGLPEPEFNEADLRDCLMRRLGPDAESPFVARNTYLAVNGFYKWWESRGGYPNPVAEARVPHAPEVERVGLTRDELRRVLQRLPERPLKEQAMVRLILHDGFRVGDVVKLEVRDIDFDHATIRARWRKGAKVQDLPMDEDLIAVLRAYLSDGRVREGYVFTGPKGRMVEQSIWKAWKRAVGKDLHHLMPHQGRHTFATALGREVKADIRTVQRLLGHKNLRTTQRYFDPSPEHETAAIIDLADWYRRRASGIEAVIDG